MQPAPTASRGYLLSRPLALDAFQTWIADRPVRMSDMGEVDAATTPDLLDVQPEAERER